MQKELLFGRSWWPIRQLPIQDIQNVREEGDGGYMVITANLDSIDTLNKIIRQLESLEGIFGVKEID